MRGYTALVPGQRAPAALVPGQRAPAALVPGQRAPAAHVCGAQRGPALLGPALLGAAVLAATCTLSAPAAQADIGGCRSDPVVTLSDGVTLDLSATIADSASDVRQTLYVLHAPVGTAVVSVVGTDGALGLTERFVFYADQPAGRYAAETVVSTGAAGVAVTATTAVVRAGGVASVSTPGQSQQALWQAVSG